MTYQKITFNADEKFDIQLSQSVIDERRFGDVLLYDRFAKWELKTERFQWEQTGNVAIEYGRDGKPSGLSVTEADWWVHELARGPHETLAYFFFPMPNLKERCRIAFKEGRIATHAGDGGRQQLVLLRLRDLLR